LARGTTKGQGGRERVRNRTNQLSHKTLLRTRTNANRLPKGQVAGFFSQVGCGTRGLTIKTKQRSLGGSQVKRGTRCNRNPHPKNPKKARRKRHLPNRNKALSKTRLRAAADMRSQEDECTSARHAKMGPYDPRYSEGDQRGGSGQGKNHSTLEKKNNGGEKRKKFGHETSKGVWLTNKKITLERIKPTKKNAEHSWGTRSP